MWDKRRTCRQTKRARTIYFVQRSLTKTIKPKHRIVPLFTRENIPSSTWPSIYHGEPQLLEQSTPSSQLHKPLASSFQIQETQQNPNHSDNRHQCVAATSNTTAPAATTKPSTPPSPAPPTPPLNPTAPPPSQSPTKPSSTPPPSASPAPTTSKPA